MTSGHRLELTYNITTRSGNAKSADFFVTQKERLKERLSGWPGDLARLVCFLDHKYSRSDLLSSGLRGRDRAIVEDLSSGCSEAGICLFFGNVTKTEYSLDCDPEYDFDDEIQLDYLCTTEGKEIASGVELSEQCLVAADSYSNRSADEEEDGECEGVPGRFKYYDSVSWLQ